MKQVISKTKKTRQRQQARSSFPLLLPADYEQVAAYLISEASRLRSLGISEDGPRIYATLFKSLSEWLRANPAAVLLAKEPTP